MAMLRMSLLLSKPDETIAHLPRPDDSYVYIEPDEIHHGLETTDGEIEVGLDVAKDRLLHRMPPHSVLESLHFGLVSGTPSDAKHANPRCTVM